MNKRPFAITDCPYFRDAWRRGVSVREIGDLYGCGKHTVTRLGHTYGYGPHPKSRGSNDLLEKRQRQVHHAKPSAPVDNPRTAPITLNPFPWEASTSQDTERRAWRDRVHSLADQGKRVTEIARDLQCLPIDVMHEVQRADKAT